MLKTTTAKSFLILCFFIISGKSNAQTKCEEQPVGERDVFFLYREFGLPNSSNLKVVVISSHIYRYKYNYGYNCPALIDGVKVSLTNAFSDKTNEIENNEYNPAADNRFNQVMKQNVKHEFAFSNGVEAKGTGPDLYLTVISATEYIKKVREKIISNYKDKGYKIFQVGFDEYFDDHLQQMKLEKIEKLSSLWIEEYRSGSIKAMAKPYQENKPESKNNNSSRDNSNTSRQGNTNRAPLNTEGLANHINWLNQNTKPTVRDGVLKYTRTFIFDEEGMHFFMDGGSYVIRWSAIQGLAPTKTDRLYIAYAGKDGRSMFEYVTPANNIRVTEVKYHVEEILIKLNFYKNTRIFGTIEDADVMDQQRFADQEAQRQADLKAAAAPGEAIAFLLNGNWEFTGVSAFKEAMKFEDIGRTPYVPNKVYSFYEVRFRIVYGSKRVRFNLAPLAFTWMELPSFKKFNSNGVQIAYDDFQETRFYSPSIGLSYVFFPKKELSNRHRKFEIPLAINYSPLWSPKNDDVTADGALDTKFKDYFKGTSFTLQGTLGVDFFLGKKFGVGFHGGAYYINVQSSEETITETVNDTQQKFTYKFDDLNKIVPHGEFKLILRF